MAVPNVFQLKDNIKRFDEIVRVLAKYGLAEWISEDTPGIIRRRFENSEGVNVADLPFEVRLRLALTELGTTFIKLGQMLSTRSDIVGPELAQELYKQGLRNFQNVLDAQRTLTGAADALAESQGAEVAALIELYRALGGGWQTKAQSPETQGEK